MSRHLSSNSIRERSVIELMEQRCLLSSATVTAHVFNDLNGDGALASGEPGLASVSVFLDKNNNGVHDTTEPLGKTNTAGSFAFAGLAAGTYHVRTVIPGGFVGAHGGNGSATLTVKAGAAATANIGLVKPVSMTGFIYNDINFNGTKDATDVFLSGWQAYIDKNNNGKLDAGEVTASSDATGKVMFSGIVPGVYVIREIVKSGWQLTGSLFFNLTVASGKSPASFNFGDTLSSTICTISATVFDDFNGNGAHETGEPLLNNWTVYLDTNGDSKYEIAEPRAVQLPGGQYQIQLIKPGTYKIREELQLGWRQVGATVFTVVAQAGKTVSASFANQAITPGIQGTIFNDLNYDAILSTTDARLANVRVFLDLNKNGVLDANEPSTLTDSTGLYHFGGLADGIYRVTHVVPIGLKPYFPVLNYTDATAATGVTVTKDFADAKPEAPTTFSGSVFNDQNTNHLRDPGEPGLANWRIYLDLNVDGAYETNEPSVLTDSAGQFTLTNVPTGRYLVKPLPPAHWRNDTTSGYGISSKITPVTGLNFGGTQVSEIGSKVYVDANKNGVLDTGETPLSGWTVYIDANNNGKLDIGEKSFVTNASGAFFWDGLAPGAYIVRIIQQPSFKLTTPAFYKITLGLGDFQVGFNFGETPI